MLRRSWHCPLAFGVAWWLQRAGQRLRVGKVLPKPFTRQQLLRAVRETLKGE